MKPCKVILWDVYGTLVTSRVGDLQALVVRADELTVAFERVIEKFDLRARLTKFAPNQTPADALQEMYLGSIADEHERKRKQGAQYPEVQIEDIWRGVLQRVNDGSSPVTIELAREVALHFEQAANPRSLYPNVSSTLLELRRRSVRLGIISNAQFYTRIQLDHMLREQSGGAITGLSTVLDERLLFWSRDFGVAKPDPAMFHRALEVLQADKITASDCMYIGNDMLHDVWLARENGMAGVLYAGDPQSVRWHLDDPRCAALKPDAVIHDHKEVLDLV